MSQSRRNGLKPTQDFTDEEIRRRMNDALRRALTSPPKPHSAMKIGKRKAKASRDLEIVFNVRELSQSIAALSSPALKRFLCLLENDISSLPFDIFVRNLVPAVRADGADKIIIGLRLRAEGEKFTAA